MNDFDEDEQQTNEQAPGSQNKGAQAGDTEPLLANSPTRSDPTGAAPKPPLEAASVVGPNPPAEPVPPAPPAEVSGSIPPAPPAPPAPAGTGPVTPPPPQGMPAPSATITAPNPGGASLPPYTKIMAELTALNTLVSKASQEVKDRLNDLQVKVNGLENLNTAAKVQVKDLKQQLEAPMKAFQAAVENDQSLAAPDVKNNIATNTNNINQSYADHSQFLMQQVNQLRVQQARDQLALAFGNDGGLTTSSIEGMDQTEVKNDEHFIDRLLKEGGTVKANQVGKNFWTHAKAWLEVRIGPEGEKTLKSNNPAVLAAAAKAAGYTSFEFTNGSPASVLKSMKEFAKQGVATSVSPELMKKFTAKQKEEFQQGMFQSTQRQLDSYKVISDGITTAQGSATLQEFSDPTKFNTKVAEEMDPALEHQERYVNDLQETSGYEVPDWTKNSVSKWRDQVPETAKPDEKFAAAKGLNSELLKNVVKSQTTYKANPQEKAVALNALMNQMTNQKESGPAVQRELKALLNKTPDRVPVVKALLDQQKGEKFQLTHEQKNDLLEALSDSKNPKSAKAASLVKNDIQKDMQQQQRLANTSPSRPNPSS